MTMNNILPSHTLCSFTIHGVFGHPLTRPEFLAGCKIELSPGNGTKTLVLGGSLAVVLSLMLISVADLHSPTPRPCQSAKRLAKASYRDTAAEPQACGNEAYCDQLECK
jgi:hypothetical protein